MSDQELRKLLSILPDEPELSTRAARARRRALARLDQPAPIARPWRWAPAVAAAVALLAGGAWVERVWRVPPLVWTPPTPVVSPAATLSPAPSAPPPESARPVAPERERLQVHFVLSDGTRVQWTFEKNFAL